MPAISCWWAMGPSGSKPWRATYQLDWWHLTRALHRTFPDRPALVAELKDALYQGDGDRLLRRVRLARATGQGDAERLAPLETYLGANQEGLYGAPRLRQRLSPQAKLVAVEGSGAIEKQMDLVVGRRFKGPALQPKGRGCAGAERGRTGCSKCG